MTPDQAMRQVLTLRDEEAVLRERARRTELNPARRPEADALFARATALRARRLEILDQWHLI